MYWLIVVGALWGISNPFLKLACKGMPSKVESTHWDAAKYLLTNWKYLVPLFVNLSGSVLFYLVLQNGYLSIAVPSANSIAFMFTMLTGWFLGEKILGTRTRIGILITALGICFYMLHLRKVFSESVSEP